jgi:hypothetical protein
MLPGGSRCSVARANAVTSAEIPSMRSVDRFYPERCVL